MYLRTDTYPFISRYLREFTQKYTNTKIHIYTFIDIYTFIYVYLTSVSGSKGCAACWPLCIIIACRAPPIPHRLISQRIFRSLPSTSLSEFLSFLSLFHSLSLTFYQLMPLNIYLFLFLKIISLSPSFYVYV